MSSPAEASASSSSALLVAFAALPPGTVTLREDLGLFNSNVDVSITAAHESITIIEYKDAKGKEGFWLNCDMNEVPERVPLPTLAKALQEMSTRITEKLRKWAEEDAMEEEEKQAMNQQDIDMIEEIQRESAKLDDAAKLREATKLGETGGTFDPNDLDPFGLYTQATDYFLPPSDDMEVTNDRMSIDSQAVEPSDGGDVNSLRTTKRYGMFGKFFHPVGSVIGKGKRALSGSSPEKHSGDGSAEAGPSSGAADGREQKLMARIKRRKRVGDDNQ
ncbi:hypothetical protein EJ08DRAFT_730791 [Tothia fuscella]|uniref:Uncharacterized protein n=1 Tax=Tothia fuscella TaxID=1048955 RepID=A0A9P4P0S4_9PEZI|nr:hypothetical protein EJ08DRAFT_730791 [Tothia fuscella]